MQAWILCILWLLTKICWWKMSVHLQGNQFTWCQISLCLTTSLLGPIFEIFPLDFLILKVLSVSFLFTCGGKLCPITNLVPLIRARLEERVAILRVWWGFRDLTCHKISAYKWHLENSGLRVRCWEFHCQGTLVKIPTKGYIK